MNMKLWKICALICIEMVLLALWFQADSWRMLLGVPGLFWLGWVFTGYYK